MTTAMPKVLPLTQTPEKFELEKATIGGISLLTIHGTLDHSFEGKKLGNSISAKKLVINMRDARRFASWGMSEWMDFLRINAGRDLYIVECSTYAVSQLNLVTGLLGHAKLVSFYASYRCGSCSEELETLFLIPRDRAQIRELPGSFQECATCGRRARLEEYPAAFFEVIADRPAFDVDDEVLSLLRSQFKYDLPRDTTRFRAARLVRKGYTYLRLSGSISAMPSAQVSKSCQGTTVVDLEGITFDPAHVAPWQTFVKSALAGVESLQLVSCPLDFLEKAVLPEDLHNKLKIRTFALSYDCASCNASTVHMVDVADHLEELARGTAPPAPCPTCKASLLANLRPEQVARVRLLPARDRDTALDSFLAKARTEQPGKLDDCLVAALPPAPAKTGGSRNLAVILTLLVLAGLAAVALVLWNNREDAAQKTAEATVTPAVKPRPTFERPDWVMFDVPSSAYCHDMINRLLCVGVSSYRTSREEAASEATDVALEELVNAVGLKISDPAFRENVMAGYSDVRGKALTALQNAELDRSSPAYTSADDVLGKSRKRVVELLRASGGAAVPAQRSDWYWEEYDAKKGGTEFLVFVRYDITLDAVKALVDKYSTTTTVMDSTTTTAFPALAWEYVDFTGGVLLKKVGRALSEAGVVANDVILAVGDDRVVDVAGFERRLDEWKHKTGNLKLLVKTGAAAPRVVEIHRDRVH